MKVYVLIEDYTSGPPKITVFLNIVSATTYADARSSRPLEWKCNLDAETKERIWTSQLGNYIKIVEKQVQP